MDKKLFYLLIIHHHFPLLDDFHHMQETIWSWQSSMHSKQILASWSVMEKKDHQLTPSFFLQLNEVVLFHYEVTIHKDPLPLGTATSPAQLCIIFVFALII